MTQPRIYQHVSFDNTFSVTVREELGRDVGNAQFIRLTLRDTERKRLNLTDKDMIPDALWENISLVASIITQTVETTGLNFSVPKYTDNAESIVAFYDTLLDLPARYLATWQTALRKVGETISPLPIGVTDEKPLTPVSSAD